MKYEFISTETMAAKLKERIAELEEEHFERSLRTDDGLTDIETDIAKAREVLAGLDN